MSQNAALLTTAAEGGLSATINSYGAGVFAHINGDWAQHTQSFLYRIPYTVTTVFTNIGTILVTVYQNAADTGTGITLTNVLGSFTASQINFYTSTGGEWYPFTRLEKSFGASMSGLWNVPSAGSYQFKLAADNLAYLFIDNNLIMSSRIVNGTIQTILKNVPLTAGNHTFLVQFLNTPGGQSGVNLTVPAGVNLIAGTSLNPDKTVAQNSLMLLLDYATLSGNPATQAVVMPAVLTGTAPPSAPPPVIVIQPVNQSVSAKSAAIFTVAAISVQSISYQWYFNNLAIAGATASTLQVTNVTSSNAGNYSVAVSNANGSTISATATLTVTT